MRSIATIRRYELFIVLAAAAAYVIRRLLELAHNFNFDINRAQNLGVSNTTILRDLASFDYNQNVIFPTVAGAVLFMGAWYVFHYHAYSQIKGKGDGINAYALIALTVGLAYSSIFLYDFLNREIEARLAADEHTIGFSVVDSSLGNVFFPTCAVLLSILLYEVCAQFYYRTLELYQQTGESRYKNQKIIALALATGFILFAISVGKIADLIMSAREFMHVASLIVLAISLFLHFFFYNKVLPLTASQLSTQQGSRKAIFIIGGYLLVSFLLIVLWVQIWGLEFYAFFLLYLLPNIIGLASAIIRQSLFTETHKLQTQVLQKTTELDTLRSQVNPHFLFNALNTLYAVALKESSEKTADGIQKLGDMMRFMLHENNQERIPLRKEIEYLHNFLDLQRMRLDEAHEIEIRVNIQEPERVMCLAPMLLNPFVENAFKHGISLRQPSWIFITLTLDATKLYFKVHNSLHRKTGDDPEKGGPGIGLDNVRKRLHLLYPNRHTLDIQATESDYFVSLVLEL